MRQFHPRHRPAASPDAAPALPRAGEAVLPALLLSLVLGAGLPSAAAAQEVRGRVLEQGTRQPVAGALVALRAPGGVRSASAITTASGTFSVVAPEPGRYTLVVERIGYRTWTSDPISLEAGQTASRTVEVPVEAVRLSEIRVVGGEERCAESPDAGPGTTRLWEEARKALTATRLTEDERRLRYRLLDFRRELEPDGEEVTAEEVTTREGTGLHPYRSLPVEELAERGYVRDSGPGKTYYAPDARALLSDLFLETHCFWTREESAGSGGRQVGLAFRPVDDRDLPDIEGVLWLDESTAELRRLEFRYTNVDLPPGAERARGEIRFRRLENGAWIVERWHILIPELARREVRVDHRLRHETVTLGYIQTGGRVGEIRDASGRPLALGESALVAGVLRDAETGAPVVGAAVSLEGTGFSATTDTAGAFRLRAPVEGSYRLTLDNPLLTLRAPPTDGAGSGSGPAVRLAPGEVVRRELRVVPSERGLAGVCEGTRVPPPLRGGHPRNGGVAGFVRDASGRPVADARVEIRWEIWTRADARAGGELERETHGVWTDTNRLGTYRACGLPTGWTLRAVVSGEGSRSREEVFRIPEGSVVRQDLRLPR